MSKKLALVAALLVVIGAAILPVFAVEDIKQHGSCKYCGMDRQKFSHSRMLIEHEDGTSTGFCSLHCAAIDLATNMDRIPRTIQVGDFNTRNLVDAEKAFWVVGGSKPGVMSRAGKWAFEKRANAEAFIKTNGGALTSFDEAIKASYNEMYEDAKMIREKRKLMRQEKTMEHKH